MRLIDADALIERCKARERDPWLKNITAASWAKAYVAFREEIDSTSTIEAEPVRHGKWKRYGTEMICSRCKAEYNIEMEYLYIGCYDSREFEGFEYCPHCGARMAQGDE